MPEPTPQNLSDVMSLFGDMFGEFFASTQVSATIELTEEEAAAGAKRDVTFERRSSCSACNGRGATDPDAIITVCKTCNGAGAVTSTQGFFQVQTACKGCNGRPRYISDPCTTCKGDGRCLEQTTQTVTIPPGVAHEQRLLLKGGGSSSADGTRGDAFITVLIAGRPRSKPPLPGQASQIAAPLPQARVHRSDQPGMQQYIVYGVVAILLGLLMLATIR